MMQISAMPTNSKISSTELSNHQLEQQIELPNLRLPQDRQIIRNNKSCSSPSSSGSSSVRVDMAGTVIPAGSLSPTRRDSLSSYDESVEEFLMNFPSDDDDDDDSDHHDHHHPEPRQKKRVSFDSIDIREYSRCLQIHPETVDGPPIGIDWKYNKVGTFDLEEFETEKENTSHLRKRRWSFLMPAKVREALLIDNGHTEEELNAVVQEVKKSKQQRRESREAQGFEDWLLMKEACKRRFKRWKTGVSKKREQELLWEKAASMRLKGQKSSQPVSLASKAA